MLSKVTFFGGDFRNFENHEFFFRSLSAFGRALATPTLINTKKVKLLNSYLKENLTKHYDSIYKTVINIKVILTLKRRKRKKSKSCETFQ